MNNEFDGIISQDPRMMPVFLLLDTSGSMSTNGKIDALNSAVNTMIHTFASADTADVAIGLCVITFGCGGVKLHRPLSICNSEDSVDFQADGMTPMGGAISMAKSMIEDKSVVTSRSYRPTVVLVSDGMPNDEWATPLKAFKETGRSKKCFRMAMSIGADSGTDAYRVLEGFVSEESKVYFAKDANDIRSYFKFVTMSVTTRSVSQDPNKPGDTISNDPNDYSEYEYDD